MDIEEVAETSPEAIHKAWFDPSDGLGEDVAQSLGDSLGLSGTSLNSFTDMVDELLVHLIEVALLVLTCIKLLVALTVVR